MTWGEKQNNKRLEEYQWFSHGRPKPNTVSHANKSSSGRIDANDQEKQANGPL
jgi:hypothetical protein